jgi:hypothetical protein
MLNNAPLVKHEPPENHLRLLCFRLAERTAFEVFILTCIILNSIILALKWYGQDKATEFALDLVNLLFTIIF